ncbi:hypothetical protein ACFSX9_00030 [Flavobacterium ardleyense]|uniref:Uncharacterized protein n=1 Tax=Flavobacterium ardleyense TaxID=2038737 RepID=A0ABW5Z2Q9_9FLAO
MKSIIKLYLKLFLQTAIIYFLIMALFDLALGNQLTLWNYVPKSLFVGVFVSLILVSIHVNKLKKNGIKNISDANVGVNQTRIISSELNKSELIQKLKSDSTIGKMEMREIENGVLFQTGMTMKSWGEEIKIILKFNKNSNFEYQVSSRPKLKTTLVDYGKNLENVNSIENLMKNIS